MSFQFAAGVDEQPAVDRPVEKRYPGFIVEVHKSREIGVTGNQSPLPAAAFFMHKVANALVDG